MKPTIVSILILLIALTLSAEDREMVLIDGSTRIVPESINPNTGARYWAYQFSPALTAYKFIHHHDEKPIFLAVHTESLWNPPEEGLSTVRKLRYFFRQWSFNYYFLSYTEEMERAVRPDFKEKIKYIEEPTSSNFYSYYGDFHHITTSSNNLVLAGGNITQCACNALRAFLSTIPTECQRSERLCPFGRNLGGKCS